MAPALPAAFVDASALPAGARPRAGAARPPSKNRVGGFARPPACRAPKNRLQRPESHRVARPAATRTASVRCFVGNNPVNAVDPLGLDLIGPFHTAPVFDFPIAPNPFIAPVISGTLQDYDLRDPVVQAALERARWQLEYEARRDAAIAAEQNACSQNRAKTWRGINGAMRTASGSLLLWASPAAALVHPGFGAWTAGLGADEVYAGTRQLYDLNTDATSLAQDLLISQYGERAGNLMHAGLSIFTGAFAGSLMQSACICPSGYGVNWGVVNPAELRWSQTTAGGNGRAANYREILARDGWKEGEFIDVVRTPDGLVTVDHTRAAVALELNMTEIPARFHNLADPLPADMLSRTWNQAGDTATTWAEALRLRGAGQTPPIGPTGSPTPPRLPRR